MGEPLPRGSSASLNDWPETPKAPNPPPLPPFPTTSRQQLSLVQPSERRKHKPKVFRVLRSVFRTFPIITPACKIPVLSGGLPDGNRGVSGSRVTGTLFGYRKGRVSLSVQENSRCLPSLVVELSMQTQVLQKEMATGMLRIALECEKRPDKDKTRVLDEPLWTMFCNGRKCGYGVKRDASEEDLNVMELLKAVSMGAGVLPGNSNVEGPDGELAYMRAHFERVVGSKDSETLYMISPEGNTGPELSIFFVRGLQQVSRHKLHTESSYGSYLTALPTAETKKVFVMEKLAQDLKKGFLDLFEAIRGSRTSQGNENVEEAKSESVEEVTVQERGIKVARGPTRPGVPKGQPPKNA
ncbi:unnamed protein product [Dovyalis caffra]|uniref:Uncharacterized protein n=1 Tax=Dovyalis caffra TaxID=77055 RepID=A0AAV1RQG0_9ROSI|nr:unnamed protein product [Dovyalis caffra]